MHSTFSPGHSSPKASTATTPDTDTLIEGEVLSELQQLARRSTHQSVNSIVEDGNPFEYQHGSRLDPNGDNFNSRAWAKAVMNFQRRDSKFLEQSIGVVWKDIGAFGHGSGSDYQKTVGNYIFGLFILVSKLAGRKSSRIDILRNNCGLLRPGEMLVVLAPPGSGSSTFLKTLAGETHGYSLTSDSHINYSGVSYKNMHSRFRGEAIYTAEQDIHFPNMTVGDTLYFAARTRAPREIPGGLSPHAYAEISRDVIMSTFGIKHTINSNVGNDFIRGVSGGERKRVTIAEAALSNAPLQFWDNSTRGLDSATAIEFCRTLKTQSEICGVTTAVAIYQAPQTAYQLFDKVTVLYDGYQIYFGSSSLAKQYFLDLGFTCPEGQTDPDFLTSMTSAEERRPRSGCEDKVPKTAAEFAAIWQASTTYDSLLQEIIDYDNQYPIDGHGLEDFKATREQQQAKSQRAASPYTLSYFQQINLCLWRGFKRLRADPSLTYVQLFGNVVMSLIVGSVFYNLPEDTSSTFSRGALLFFAVLINAFGSQLEMLVLYNQRPIIEKHDRYALYHPSAEAVSSMLTDLPYKILNTMTANLPLYFLTNLRREAGPFFIFLLVSFLTMLVMSKLFRTIASVSRSLHQALAPATVFICAIIIYAGFAIPQRYMLGWARWIIYINPLAYAFEALVSNEFAGRQFLCADLVPPYSQASEQSCTTVGSVPGSSVVSGDAFIEATYGYDAANKWRAIGIVVVLTVGLLASYLVAAELVTAKKSKGEVLVFPRTNTPPFTRKSAVSDVETSSAGLKPHVNARSDSDASAIIQKQTAIFQWHNVCYDIKIKNESRRILDNVDGWVKPGTLTALMGVSGAGKTTLLDVLASRVTMGVIEGQMLVDGRQRDASFQRKTGYVQQQDLHLETSTVREALEFSAILRQPDSVSIHEKKAYVTEVIKLLEMEDYENAVVGVPGEGLNVEQRKRLTIGVEMAARPALLLFLDEPTSGLDSQTSWSILSLLEKLARNGQAILCTIHQPSSILFQRFDRLLLLARGGKTVYFGPIGDSSRTLMNYFVENGATPCPKGENPAEWMLDVIGASAGSRSKKDWSQVWRESNELKDVHRELAYMQNERSKIEGFSADSGDQSAYNEYAVGYLLQLYQVQKRVFQQYWRTPSYIYSKLLLCVGGALFIGLSFVNASNTIQGLQNQLFGVFMLTTFFSEICQQIMPHFVTQRSLYEVRERPSKTYSWQTFMLSNILVEIPWSFICSVLIFICWYYPIGLYRNAQLTDAVHERGAMTFLFVFAFLLFASSFAHMSIAAIDTAENASNIVNLAFILMIMFCGVLAPPDTLPRFWIFMYRVSPMTYVIGGILSAAISDAEVTCAAIELVTFSALAGETCGDYAAPMLQARGGYVVNSGSIVDCQYCPISSSNQFLARFSVNPAHAWRNLGIVFGFIVFNSITAVLLYWIFRVPKQKLGKKGGRK